MTDATATNGQELRTRRRDDALSVLMDADIDKVMSGLDRSRRGGALLREAVQRWQRQQWSTEDFDFTEDAKQWADPDFFTEEERKFMMFGFSEFFLGEERVTVELLPVRARRAHARGEGVPDHARSRTRPSTPSSGTGSTARSSEVDAWPGSAR